MSRSDPSILAASSKLRGVSFHDVECLNVEGKGWGLVTTCDLTAKDTDGDEPPQLMGIPHDLVLNQQTVEEYAKESREFKELYDAVGRQVFYSLALYTHTVRLTYYRLLISDFPHSLRGVTSCCSSLCNWLVGIPTCPQVHAWWRTHGPTT